MPFLFLILTLLSLRLDAAETTVLSATGKQKASQSRELLDSNLKGIAENLETTRKNVATIEAEIEELEALERRHLSLKTNLERFLAKASNEFKENGAALESDKGAKKGEAEQRAAWKVEAEARLAKAQNTLHELNVNLRQVESRKEPLRGQLLAWRERAKELERLQTELSSVKEKSK